MMLSHRKSDECEYDKPESGSINAGRPLNNSAGDFMKSIVINVISAVTLLVTGSVWATSMPPLAKKYGCTNCHAFDVKMIGPSFMDISIAYNINGKTSNGTPVSAILGSKTAEEWLKQKISHGGAGIWGTVLMPATDPSDTSQASMDMLVKDILGLSEGSSSNDDMLNLANYYHCSACHSLDKPGIGPSWMDISKVYNSKGTTPYGVKVSDTLKSKTAEEWLILKISHGGLGNWGTMLMPPIEYRTRPGSTAAEHNEAGTAKDIRKLARIILGLAKL